MTRCDCDLALIGERLAGTSVLASHPLPAAWQGCEWFPLGFCGNSIKAPGVATALPLAPSPMGSAVDLVSCLLAQSSLCCDGGRR
ncbi:hypothetical protein [Synechococcus sp. UW105]|uniref:hypothetical protein n=1 Tax=Synechococcus sp. UW105 TaxID=337067 RepID=UPI000E0E4592|nr:hypothetical protein [Synechococcus sp. UW105]